MLLGRWREVGMWMANDEIGAALAMVDAMKGEVRPHAAPVCENNVRAPGTLYQVLPPLARVAAPASACRPAASSGVWPDEQPSPARREQYGVVAQASRDHVVDRPSRVPSRSVVGVAHEGTIRKCRACGVMKSDYLAYAICDRCFRTSQFDRVEEYATALALSGR